MRRRDETAHSETFVVAWDEPERVQEEIRLHNADSLGCKVIDQNEEQVCKKEGAAREAAEIH